MENFINESVIVAIATTLFVTALFKPAKKTILSFLDNKIIEAATKIKEAESMKKEAEDMLSQIHHELKLAKITAQEIIDSAQEKSIQILEDAKHEFDKISQRKTELAMERISQQEKVIIDEFKGEVLTKALTQVESSLSKQLSSSAKISLLESSLNTLKRNLN